MAQQDSGLDPFLLRIFSGILGLCSLCTALPITMLFVQTTVTS